MTQYKVTCLDDTDYDGKQGARIDASSKRWATQDEAEAYARTVARGRYPQVVAVDAEIDAYAAGYKAGQRAAADYVLSVIERIYREADGNKCRIKFESKVALGHLIIELREGIA